MYHAGVASVQNMKGRSYIMKLNGSVACLLAVLFGIVLMVSITQAEWLFVDLEPYANSQLSDMQWWTENAQNGLTDFDDYLALGVDQTHELEGLDEGPVPFLVVDANLRIFGSNAAANPIEITGIEIGAQARFLYFLHMTGWETVGEPSYKFVIHYQGGSSEELLMESNVNSDNWDQVPAPLADPNSAWVWQEPAQTVGQGGLIATRWENPASDKWIESVDFISLEKGAVPALFAITLGEASAAVAPGRDKLPVVWAELR